MKEFLISLLERFHYPVRQQGSLGEKEAYPDSFFTFWNNSSDDGNHYDNDAANWIWNFDVMFYSIYPTLVNSILEDVKSLLREHGFVVAGKGFDVASDEPTHTGRGITVLYSELNLRGE